MTHAANRAPPDTTTAQDTTTIKATTREVLPANSFQDPDNGTRPRSGMSDLLMQIDTTSAAGRSVLHVFGVLVEFERQADIGVSA